MARKETIARHYVVRGRVQGVGFRAFVNHGANALGVRGWVRNTDDGSVEVLAMGNQEQINELTAMLHRGPRFSEVRTVEETEAALIQSSGFTVRY
jgi:acylphosphatase